MAGGVKVDSQCRGSRCCALDHALLLGSHKCA
jgi:hypothetical protein